LLWKIGYHLLYPLFKILFRLEIRGKENLPQGGAILVSNHKSYLDPIVLGLATKRPISFMAKVELFKYPFFSSLIKAFYAFPVRREEADKKALKEGVKRIKSGFLLGIFPEGTRVRSEEIGDFKPGLAFFYRLTKAPIVPAAVIGTRKVLMRKGILPYLGKIKVVIGKPLRFEGGNVNEEELTKKIRERVVKLYREET
jgi:1-acyl-sn-glycerol-3-phosphate acyltransferase